MEILNINLPANGRTQFRKAGSYLEIIASTGLVGINFYSNLGGQTDSISNGLSGLFMQTDYGAFDLIEQSGIAQTVQILVCDIGETGGSRRQPGNVKVIDQSVDQTLGGLEYFQGNACGASAGQGSLLTITPGARGCAILSMLLYSGTAGIMHIGPASGTGTLAGGGGAMNSKLIGGTPSNAFVAAKNCVGLDPTAGELAGFGVQAQVVVAANTPTALNFKTPLILKAPTILVVSGFALNRDIGMVLETREF